eukprot:CAMPEP_0198213768 /NCGR_PEP_ID=MMETSP1445-20131203/32418_1 /TAXON_ID=36898 /ORGANISM="Pyramimonas sp., Strain CCMP2087" /LENGTH=55 /DNA_ID=CAMNT_0043888525 /DNA_START=6 /DNA_END=169 /DNA_ORIENTATION=-
MYADAGDMKDLGSGMSTIILGSMQVLGQLFGLFTDQIPAQLRNLMKYLSILNFNV